MASFKFLKYLREDTNDDLPSESIKPQEKGNKNSVLVEKIYEVENEKAVGFIDEETGKIYKTERGLKAARTRRLNKAKKARKDDK